MGLKPEETLVPEDVRVEALTAEQATAALKHVRWMWNDIVYRAPENLGRVLPTYFARLEGLLTAGTPPEGSVDGN